MFAIGACVDCSTPLCGTHGGRFEGAFVCSEHFAERQRRRQQIAWERDAPRRAAEQAKAEREYAARQAELDLYQRDRLRFMDAVLELEDGSEQVVVTVARTAADVQGECSDRGVVSALFPQLWPTPDKVDFAADLPRWNSSAIARWYASRAKGRVPYARYDRKSRYNEMWFEPMLGRPRKGWVFPSAKVIVHPAYTEKSPVQMKCFVEHTGAFFQQGNPANTRRMRAALIGPGGDLNSAALIEMANRARAGRGVPRLETPARLAAPLGFDMPVPTDREAVEAAALAAERASLKH